MLGVKPQFPEALVTAVPAAVPSKKTFTVLLASAVPEMTGVVVLTSAPLAGVTTTGGGGGVPSRTTPAHRGWHSS